MYSKYRGIPLLSVAGGLGGDLENTLLEKSGKDSKDSKNTERKSEVLYSCTRSQNGKK